MMNESSTKSTHTIPWRLAITMVIIAIIPLSFVWMSHQELTELDLQLKDMTAQHEQRLSQIGHLRLRYEQVLASEKQSIWDRQQLEQIYSTYRDVDDFSENPSQLIVSTVTSSGPMNNTLRFSLPPGDHQLQIDITKTSAGSKEVIDQLHFDYPLIGGAGYFLKLDHPQQPEQMYRDSRQLTLDLSSTEESFQPVSQTVFEPFPPPSGSSSSNGFSIETVAYPNQYNRFSKDIEPGVGLNRMVWSIVEPDEQRYDLRFEIRVTSDGPVVADPSTANRLLYNKGFNVQYLRDGMYEVMKSDETTP